MLVKLEAAVYVCVCKGITDHQIKAAVTEGATSVGRLRKHLGVASQCGKCACLTREIIDETLSQHQQLLPKAPYYALA